MLKRETLSSARKSVLCWLATADAYGQPNVSPKEIFLIHDNAHLLIANIASPTSVRNIEVNPQVCVSFIEIFVQKGFKVLGTARNVYRRDTDYAHWAAPLQSMAGSRFPIRSVIVVSVATCEPILAPSYQLYASETTEQAQVASAMQAYGVKPLGGLS